MPHIPFHTVAERNLVLAYLAVWTLQFGYATRLFLAWRKSARRPTPPELGS